MPAVALVVVRLLERPQHEARQRAPAPPAGREPSTARPAARPLRSDPPPAAGSCAPSEPAASARPATRADRSAARPRAPRDARARGTASARAVDSSSRATCSLAAIIRCSIIRCDSVCSTGSAATTLPRLVERRTPARPTRATSAARDARRSPSAAAAARATPSAGPHAPAPRSRPVEDPVDAAVVEPLVGSDHRAVERAAADLGSVEHAFRPSPPGDPVPVRASRRGWRAPRGASARRRRGRTRWSRAGRPRGRAATAAARRRTRRRCAPTRAATRRSAAAAEIASSKSRALAGSIVNVGSERRSRRRRRPGAVLDRERPRGHVARLVLDRGIEAPAQPAVDHQRLDHVARDVRAAEPARDNGRPTPRRARCAPDAGADDDQVADGQPGDRGSPPAAGRARRTARRPGTCRAARAPPRAAAARVSDRAP